MSDEEIELEGGSNTSDGSVIGGIAALVDTTRRDGTTHLSSASLQQTIRSQSIVHCLLSQFLTYILTVRDGA